MARRRVEWCAMKARPDVVTRVQEHYSAGAVSTCFRKALPSRAVHIVPASMTLLCKRALALSLLMDDMKPSLHSRLLCSRLF